MNWFEKLAIYIISAIIAVFIVNKLFAFLDKHIFKAQHVSLDLYQDDDIFEDFKKIEDKQDFVYEAIKEKLEREKSNIHESSV